MKISNTAKWVYAVFSIWLLIVAFAIWKSNDKPSPAETSAHQQAVRDADEVANRAAEAAGEARQAADVARDVEVKAKAAADSARAAANTAERAAARAF